MKKSFRENLLITRDSIEPQKKKEKETFIIKRLFNTPEFKKAKSILFYASFRSEVDTMGCLNSAIKLGKKIGLPKVDREQRCLRLYEIKDTTEVQPNYMGIPEPSILRGRKMDLKDIDIAVVPGAGFDTKGNRLGYGAGYYDKLLSGSRKHITTIALAFEEQIVPGVPREGHDVRVDKIITEKRVIDCG